MMRKNGILNLKKFGDRIIFMSMFNDIDWTRKRNEEICLSNAHWTFLGLGNEKKSCGGHNCEVEGKWNSIASQMKQRFKETGHQIFTSASALSRGNMRKVKGKETIYFNTDTSNTVLLFRIIHSANQLSIHGAVLKMM